MINQFKNPEYSRYSFKRRIKDVIDGIPRYLYSLFNLPGFVRSVDYADNVTGDHIRIRVGWRYTVVAINNREYWFRRVTGKFDGTGYAYRNSNEGLLHCILADIPESIAPLSLWGRLKRLVQSRN